MHARLECLLVHTIIQSYIAQIILRSLLRLCCRSLFIFDNLLEWNWIVLASKMFEIDYNCGKVCSPKIDLQGRQVRK